MEAGDLTSLSSDDFGAGLANLREALYVVMLAARVRTGWHGKLGDFDHLRPMLERNLALFKAEFGVAPPMPEPPVEGRLGLGPCLLDAGARVIIPDLRGFGASDKPQETAAYANSAMARDVVALIDHLGLDAVDVLGFSMVPGFL